MYTVADFIIQVKNAYLARRKTVVVRYANITREIAKTLIKERMLSEVKEETVDGQKVLSVTLRYEKRKPTVSEVKIVSKPSLRVYLGIKDLKTNQRKDAMVSVLSTPLGIMSGKEAIKKGVGGELLFKVW